MPHPCIERRTRAAPAAAGSVKLKRSSFRTKNPPGTGTRLVALAALVVPAVLVPARSARAQTVHDDLLTPPVHAPPNAVEWDASWPRFRDSELWATGALAAVAIGSFAIPYGSGRWKSTNGFDTSARSALRLSGELGRDRAQDASDILLTVSVNYLVVDSALVTWWGHGRGSVALQMALIDIEALAVTMAATSLTKGITARARPYGAECTGPAKRQDRDCRGMNRYDSFFSGHTSISFTAAALTCQHHAHLPLYGGGVPDALACAAGFALAGTTGAMRVMSDRHWLSDSLVGAAVGTISGLTIPWALHYRGGAKPAPPTDRKGASLHLVPAPMGGAIVGEF